MVGVLDVLCQPVLGPVDGLTVDGCLHVIEDDEELVMLHLVINTVEKLNVAEPRLLKVEVELHVLPHDVEGLLALGMLRDGEDVGEEDVMLSINPGVICGKGGIPDIGLGNLVLKVPLVSKVCVLDMLHQPVLGPLEFLNVHRRGHLVEPGAEYDVLLLVLLAVVPGKVERVTELLLLGVEMISHQLLEVVHKVLIVEVTLNRQHGLKETDVLGVHLNILHEK